MKTKLQIKSVIGKVLFEYEVEDNTIRKTLIEAIKSGANLLGADLSYANLLGANLRDANLRSAYLRDANLLGANLRDANLRSADLSYADLSSADLSYANLSGADLSYANLLGANLLGANLRYANLRGADLRSANLSGADLRGADLNFNTCLFSTKTDKKYIQLGGIGSSLRATTYCVEDDTIFCGCFRGTLAEFEKQIEVTHSNNPFYLSEYRIAVKYIQAQAENYKTKKL